MLSWHYFGLIGESDSNLSFHNPQEIIVNVFPVMEHNVIFSWYSIGKEMW